MIVDRINEYLSKNDKIINETLRYEVEKLAGSAFRRQFMENNNSTINAIRLSSAGHCPRQIAYSYWGFEHNGKEIDSRAKIVFWTGDMAEMMIISLAKIAGCQILATGLQQIPVHLIIDGIVIKGHPDGILIINKARIIETKSMSSFSFKNFEKGKIDDLYLAQVNGYMESEEMKVMGIDEAIFVALNKDNGLLGEQIIKKDKKIIEKLKENFRKVIKSLPNNLPDPPNELIFDPKTKYYPWKCLYCSYWGHCRINAEKVLVGKSYKLKEKVISNTENTGA